jgi:hypothetical protein
LNLRRAPYQLDFQFRRYNTKAPQSFCLFWFLSGQSHSSFFDPFRIVEAIWSALRVSEYWTCKKRKARREATCVASSRHDLPARNAQNDPYVLAALQMPAAQYSLASLRYDLRKLRAKDLVEKLPKSRRYRLRPQGYSICLVFLKLFERVYSPLTAGLLQPYPADSKLQDHKRTQLDRLYQKIVDDLDELLHAVGLKAA